jgi:hypothetical protein
MLWMDLEEKDELAGVAAAQGIWKRRARGCLAVVDLWWRREFFLFLIFFIKSFTKIIFHFEN